MRYRLHVGHFKLAVPVERRIISSFLDADVQRVFFFQAEDGIRDLTVTGVQTCALPILALFSDKLSETDKELFERREVHRLAAAHVLERGVDARSLHQAAGESRVQWRQEIGRASCRGRV